MEETPTYYQSPLAWSSTQDLPTWSKQPKTTGQELVDDLKVAGATVTKMTINNTLRCSGLKLCNSRKVPLLKKAYVQARLKFAIKYLDNSVESWEKVLLSNETKIELLGINSTRRLWKKKKVTWTPRTPFQLFSMVVETLFLC